jgi:hypothetical protein
MNASSAVAASVPRAIERSGAIPAYCYILVFGAMCIPMGVLWDVSWHSTIGRDTFWTPAHMLTYLGGLIPGLTCGWLALKTHFFGSSQERAAAVSFWGFRAPLGAWVVIWGTFTMLLSAPFDDWWHNAYGLDVKILSPPHTVLAIGMLAVALGILFLMVSWQNRSSEENPGAALLFAFVAGILLLMASIFLTEASLPNQQHASRFYLMSSRPYPLYLIAAARASRLRWPATIMAGVYMTLLLMMVWILPLFEGHPKLAPVYNPLDHMVPPAFPLLLIVPAVGIDLLMRLYKRLPAPVLAANSSRWKRFLKSGFLRDTLFAVVLGAAFMGIFMATQWNFSKFLISPAADNWFFAGGHFFPYYSGSSQVWRHRFWELDVNPVTVRTWFLATCGAFITARIGLGLGKWMSKVQR